MIAQVNNHYVILKVTDTTRHFSRKLKIINNETNFIFNANVTEESLHECNLEHLMILIEDVEKMVLHNLSLEQT